MKTVRWKIPFVSIQGVHYQVNIYDEGVFTPIELMAGPTAFVTEEDASDDFFHPVRTQTGTLQVCTKIEPQEYYPSGGTLSLNDILPENNIARPVRLMNLDTSPATIEWQGFLSCEAYTQDYTGIPQILNLSIISVLEAMDSVYLDNSTMYGLEKIHKIVYRILHKIEAESDEYWYSHINYSQRSFVIFTKYLNQSIFFKENTVNDDANSRIITTVTSISAKEAIEMLCTFMGWTVREQGTEIYFERIYDDPGMLRMTLLDFYNDPTDAEIIYNQIIDIEDLTWMGTKHIESVLQGAKTVSVKSSVDSDLLSLRLPSFPYGNTSSIGWITTKYKDNSGWSYFYSILNYNNYAHDTIEYNYYSGELERTGDYSYTANYIGVSTKNDFLDRLTLAPHASGNIYIGRNPLISGAILVNYEITEEQVNNHSFSTGLYCPLLPGLQNMYLPIFKMKTFKKYSFNVGQIVISAKMLFNILSRYNSENQPYLTDKINDSKANLSGERLRFSLRIGDLYYNQTTNSWTDEVSTFQVNLYEDGFEEKINIAYGLYGDVELSLMAGVTVGTHINTLYEVIFKSLNVNYYPYDDYLHSDRTTNNYLQILNTNFRDEISVDSKLSSDMYNKPAESIIMNSETNSMKTMVYWIDIEIGRSDTRRPEKDLLDRLAAYYGAARQRLELEVEHPTDAPLPLLKLNGIGDGKVYLPLSESRDWQTGVCKLTCFESPELAAE